MDVRETERCRAPRGMFDPFRIHRARSGFAIADRVLHDTLEDHGHGESDTADLLLALEQHRRAYEAYLRALYSCVRR